MKRLALVAALVAAMLASGPAYAQAGGGNALTRGYVYGFQLMSAAERDRFREQMQRVRSAEECAALNGRWQAELERRAAEAGKTLVPERGEFCRRREAESRNLSR
jgi:hypothetical protein